LLDNYSIDSNAIGLIDYGRLVFRIEEGAMAGGASGRYKELVSLILRSENLDELPEANLVPKRTSFFSRLMKSEDLPLDDPASGAERRSTAATGLFAAEELPLDIPPAPSAGHRSFIASLFSRETLPDDPVPVPGAVGHGPGH